MTPYLIGIAGPSCSGKSLLAVHLGAHLEAAVFSLDSYYRPLDHLSPEQRAAHNFDRPEALDSDLLLEHLRLLQQGRAVESPVYDLVRQTRSAETVEFAPRPYLIIEGLFALHWEQLRARMGTKIYVDADEELCLVRRIERDIRERGRTRESVLQQYHATVAPMARQSVYPARAHADLVISGKAEGVAGPVDSAFSRQIEAILQHVRQRVQSL